MPFVFLWVALVSCQVTDVDTVTTAIVSASFPGVAGDTCFARLESPPGSVVDCVALATQRTVVFSGISIPADALLLVNAAVVPCVLHFGCGFVRCGGRAPSTSQFDISVGFNRTAFVDVQNTTVAVVDVALVGPRAQRIVVSANEQLSLRPTPTFLWTASSVTVTDGGRLLFFPAAYDDGNPIFTSLRAASVTLERGAVLEVQIPSDFAPEDQGSFSALLVSAREIAVSPNSVVVETTWPNGSVSLASASVTLELQMGATNGRRDVVATFVFNRVTAAPDGAAVGDIVAAVVAVLVVLGIGAVLSFFWFRHRQTRRSEPARYEAAAPAELLQRDRVSINDAVSQKNRVSTNDAEFISARAERLHQIDAAELELGTELGRGAFGVVRRGEWRGRTVAVKQIKTSAIGDSQAVAAFEDEIARMAALQPHENVVQLYGVADLPNGDVAAVVEYCAQGALADALYGAANARQFSDAELLHVAYDAACGVMHLHANSIVHRDIAARNVLLAGKRDLVAKVSDFGMARELDSTHSSASEQQTAASVGPIRWMAPEQLERLAYSKASDVFAFGVLLYEIFARSAPWPGVANVNVIAKVIAGGRMPLPESAPAHVAAIVTQCWLQDPAARPSMRSVCRALN